MSQPTITNTVIIFYDFNLKNKLQWKQIWQNLRRWYQVLSSQKSVQPENAVFQNVRRICFRLPTLISGSVNVDMD